MSTAHAAESHGEAHLKAYLVVFIALACFTAVSFVSNWATHPDPTRPDFYYITAHTSLAIILGVAIIKALLVAMIFMHLKIDWRKVYFMIIPALILGTMMMIVFMPDQVLYWKNPTALPNPPAPPATPEK